MKRLSFKDACEQYWKYYSSLEKQFMETERYVEFDYINNKKTYSIEYLKLFQAVCSEVDVVGKELAKQLHNNFTPSKNTGINEWWYHIISANKITDWSFNNTGVNNSYVKFTSSCNDLTERTCMLLGREAIQPWKDYTVIRNPKKGSKRYILDSNHQAKTPFWWGDYNSVKHNRTEINDKQLANYTKANLGNLFNAFAALYSLEVVLLGSIYLTDSAETLPLEYESKLFLENPIFYTYVSQVR